MFETQLESQRQESFLDAKMLRATFNFSSAKTKGCSIGLTSLTLSDPPKVVSPNFMCPRVRRFLDVNLKGLRNLSLDNL